MTASSENGSEAALTASAPAAPVQSLGRRLVLATLVFGIVFTTVAAAVRTWSAWQNNVAVMTAELKLIEQVFGQTLAKAIWEIDRKDLRTQLDGVAQVSAVAQIELSIPRAGRPPETMERHRSGSTGSSLAPSVHRVLTYEPYPGTTEIVGEVTLVGDEQVLWDRLQGELAGIVAAQVVQTLLLAGLIMWMFNRTVTVHVRDIAHHLDGLTPDNLDHTLQLARTVSRRDELSLLESGVNQLQSNLSTYLERQRRDEGELAAHRDRLAELVQEQTTELRAANAQLEALSRSDPLTGLANRRHFDDAKESEFRRAQRLGRPLSVLTCDVDYFKRYNDTYGHALGDRCLQAIAEVLKQTFTRAGELPARIGGEEFAVLLPAVDAAQAREAAERLRRAVAEQAIPHAGSPVAPHVTLSIGMAQFEPATMASFDALLEQADLALYRAKSLGRNQVAA